MQSDKIHTVYGSFPDHLNVSNLADICVQKNGVQTGPFGSQLHQKDYVEKGIPIITVEHLGENRINHGDTPFVSDDDYNRLIKYNLREGDIVFSRVGSVDRRALVSEDEDGWLFSGRCLRVRPNNEIVDSTYLSYFFGLNVFKKYVRSIAVGATMPSINTKILSDLPIVYPSLPTQKKIAHILSTLDDKIELNRKMNQTLEMVAQALFKSWFVDFDPVYAKSDAELEKAATELGIAKEVLELFPSELKESEMGMIPKGWSQDSLSNHISVTKGKSYKSSELEESTTALVTLKSFLRGGGYRTDGIKPYTGKYKDEQVVQPGELIMAYTDVTQAADVIGKPAIVLKDESIDTLVASLDVGIVRVNSQAVNIMFLYQLFKTRRFQGYILGHTSGTTVLHLAKGWFDSYTILLPKQEIMDAFNKLVSPLFKQIQLNIEQERSLQKTRDILLPKLLSGELDVSRIKI